jgi:putative ABC transport system substrate-binding protein
MKKKLTITVGLICLVGLGACQETEKRASALPHAPQKPATRHVSLGVVYLLEHPAINAGLSGFRSRLEEISKRDDVKFDTTYTNAFGDAKTAAEAVDGFRLRNADAIVALTTPCAQIARQKVQDRPIIFVGVSDPVAAGLVDSLNAGKANVVGTTSRPPYLRILRTAAQAFPAMHTVGIVYSAQEANSESAVRLIQDSVQKELPEMKIKTRTVANTAEINAACRALLRSVDGIFVLDDNATVSAIEVIVRACKDARKPVFACDADSVRRGALFAHAIDYSKEGTAAADLVENLLLQHRPPASLPVAINEATTFYVNNRTFSDFPDVKQSVFASAARVQ